MHFTANNVLAIAFVLSAAVQAQYIYGDSQYEQLIPRDVEYILQRRSGSSNSDSPPPANMPQAIRPIKYNEFLKYMREKHEREEAAKKGERPQGTSARSSSPQPFQGPHKPAAAKSHNAKNTRRSTDELDNLLYAREADPYAAPEPQLWFEHEDSSEPLSYRDLVDFHDLKARDVDAEYYTFYYR